jgi:D-galactarolactone cycloisomerase
LLASIDNGGYFEADVAKKNVYRDGLTSVPYEVDKSGNVFPLDKPGIGVEVDEELIKRYPVIEGPAFV